MLPEMAYHAAQQRVFTGTAAGFGWKIDICTVPTIRRGPRARPGLTDIRFTLATPDYAQKLVRCRPGKQVRCCVDNSPFGACL
jgi:hypothetical protein